MASQTRTVLSHEAVKSASQGAPSADFTVCKLMDVTGPLWPLNSLFVLPDCKSAVEARNTCPLTARSTQRACQPDSAVQASSPEMTKSKILLLSLSGLPMSCVASILRSRLDSSAICWEVWKSRPVSVVCILMGGGGEMWTQDEP